MFTKYIFLITTALTAFCQLTHAQAKEDLRSLLAKGLESNYELQIIRLEEQSAAENATRANAGFLPSADISGGAEYDSDNTSESSKAAPDEIKSSNDTRKYDLGVGLSWTLFDGFSVQTNYDKFLELEQQSKVETRIAVEDYIAELSAEYYNYIKQKNSLRILKQAVELSRERLRITEARYVVGNFSRLDYRQAQVYFNTDSASYIKQQEIVKSASIRLKEMTVSDKLNEELLVKDSTIHLDISLDYDRLIDAMRNNNAELLYADHDVTLSEYDLKLISARKYPNITFSSGYSYDNSLQIDTNRAKARTHGIDASINLSFRLFDPKQKSLRRNAELNVEQTKLNREAVILQLDAQFKDLWQAYVNNQRLLHLERSNLSAARETYEIAHERYMLGNLAGIELREAQISLLDAEERIVSATYDTKICEISLLQMSGEIDKYL